MGADLGPSLVVEGGVKVSHSDSLLCHRCKGLKVRGLQERGPVNYVCITNKVLTVEGCVTVLTASFG